MSNFDYRHEYSSIPSSQDMMKALEKLEAQKEMVNHPKHYNVGELEAITVIEDQGLGEAFCASNIIKYIMRYKHKGTPLEDLKKIKWYTERLISYYENSNKK